MTVDVEMFGAILLFLTTRRSEIVMIKRTHGGNSAAVISSVDQGLRECLQVLWLALPRDRANEEELEINFKRLADRAVRDFKEDLTLFPPYENQRK